MSESELTPGHRAALARARLTSSARARLAAYTRHGVPAPAELVETLHQLAADPRRISSD